MNVPIGASFGGHLTSGVLAGVQAGVQQVINSVAHWWAYPFGLCDKG